MLERYVEQLPGVPGTVIYRGNVNMSSSMLEPC